MQSKMVTSVRTQKQVSSHTAHDVRYYVLTVLFLHNCEVQNVKKNNKPDVILKQKNAPNLFSADDLPTADPAGGANNSPKDPRVTQGLGNSVTLPLHVLILVHQLTVLTLYLNG